MVEPHFGDVFDVGLGYVRAEVLHVADGDFHAPLLGQDVEALVVRKPPAYAHSALEALEFRALRAESHKRRGERGE